MASYVGHHFNGELLNMQRFELNNNSDMIKKKKYIYSQDINKVLKLGEVGVEMTAVGGGSVFASCLALHCQAATRLLLCSSLGGIKECNYSLLNEIQNTVLLNICSN